MIGLIAIATLVNCMQFGDLLSACVTRPANPSFWFYLIPAHRICPEEKPAEKPARVEIEATDVDVKLSDFVRTDNNVCKISSYMMTVDAATVYHALIYAKSDDGTTYLVHTDDLYNFASHDAAMERVAASFPVGSEVNCTPEIILTL